MHFSKDHLGTESDRNRTRSLKSQLFLALSVVSNRAENGITAKFVPNVRVGSQTRSFGDVGSMSGWPQSGQSGALLDHLVGRGEKRRWDITSSYLVEAFTGRSAGCHEAGRDTFHDDLM